MPTQQTIHFRSDGYRLTGSLHLPEKPRPAVVIGCHGLLADRTSPKQIALGEALNRAGIAFLRFDHRGCGDSGGRLEMKNLLSSRCGDLYQAITFIQGQADLGGVTGLFGSSFGGTVVMAAAAATAVPLLVTYAAPIYSRSVGMSAGKEIRAHHGLRGEDVEALDFDIRPLLPSLRNILIMHSSSDEIVPPEHARDIFSAAAGPKKLIFFEGGDHRLTCPSHQRRFLAESLAWFTCLSAG